VEEKKAITSIVANPAPFLQRPNSGDYSRSWLFYLKQYEKGMVGIVKKTEEHDISNSIHGVIK